VLSLFHVNCDYETGCTLQGLSCSNSFRRREGKFRDFLVTACAVAICWSVQQLIKAGRYASLQTQHKTVTQLFYFQWNKAALYTVRSTIPCNNTVTCYNCFFTTLLEVKVTDHIFISFIHTLLLLRYTLHAAR